MKKTLFMIHGMCGGVWCWENYITYFEGKGYRCITPTLRYHDVDPKASPEPLLGTTGLLEYAEDLEREIKTLDDTPIIMGHSMGGLLAQILGSRGLAEALVLLTPASPHGINALKFSVLKSFWGVMTKWGFIPRWGFWRNPHRLSFGKAVYSMMQLLPENEQKAAYRKFVYESGRAAFQIGFWLLDPRSASKVDETKVTCPVLVIAGKEDRITPPSVVNKVAKKYRHVSKYREFANHSHWVIGEPGWEEIADYIAEWSNRNTAKG